jgi:hypothetical protein
VISVVSWGIIEKAVGEKKLEKWWRMFIYRISEG